MDIMETDDILKKLLALRGIETEEDILEFLSDKPKKTYDPFLLPDMEEGMDLILSEIAAGSKIMIYGDYDADGITATSLLLDVLRAIMGDAAEERLDYYIPSRFDEGYGLNPEAIRSISEEGTDLIITVDCGSVAEKEVELAKELDMKILVTDHHNITDKMADCLLINPKRPDSLYPFAELSGVGVAFKLAQALQRKSGKGKDMLTEVLDLVAMGTIGDIMPLVDENRTLVKYGLRVINSGNRRGLLKLIEGAGLTVGEVSSENVGFIIVPHLNAAGRIEDASLAVKLLAGRLGEAEEEKIVRELLAKNQERKYLQNQAFKKCLETGEKGDFILIRNDEVHEGIAGIVAGKIKDEYYRPSVIVMNTGKNGILKGTGRSIEGVNLYALLKKYENLFEKFGGHSGACGFSMKEENYIALKEGLLVDTSKLREDEPELFKRKYRVDSDISIDDATVELGESIDVLAPFGNSNPKPAFRISEARIEDMRYLGADEQHLRFAVSSDGGKLLSCILFNKAADFKGRIATGDIVEVIGSMEMKTWQGKKRISFIVENIID